MQFLLFGAFLTETLRELILCKISCGEWLLQERDENYVRIMAVSTAIFFCILTLLYIFNLIYAK